MSQSITNQGRIHVPAPATVAFQIFTPRGKHLWTDEWRPHFPQST